MSCNHCTNIFIRYLESIVASARARNQRNREHLARVRTTRENDNIAEPISSTQNGSAVDHLVASLSEQQLGNSSYSAGAPWTIGRGRRELGASDWSLADSRGDIGLAHRNLRASVAETSHNIAGTTDIFERTPDYLEGIRDNPECTANSLEGNTDNSEGSMDNLEGNTNRTGERDTMVGSAAARQVRDEIFRDVERRSLGLSLDPNHISMVDTTTGAHTTGGIQGLQNTLTVSARNASGVHQGLG